MPKDDKLKEVHKLMRQEYADTPMNYEDFKQSMLNPEVNKQVHSLLKSKYEDVPRNLTTFQNALGLKKKISQQDFEEQTLGYSRSEESREYLPDYLGGEKQDKGPLGFDTGETIDTGYGKVEKPNMIEGDTKDDVARSFDEGDPKTIVKTRVQQEYADKFPGALTPPEKLNKFQDELSALQDDYSELIDNKPIKRDVFVSRYKDEIKQIADDLGLIYQEDGKVSVSDQEIETYKDIYKKNFKKTVEDQREEEKSSFGRDVLERLASSAERLYNIPTNILAISEKIHNSTMKLFDKDYDEQEYWKDVAQYRQQKTEELRQKSVRYDGSITELVKRGEIGKAAGETALQLVEQIPQLLTFAGTGAAGAGQKGLGYIATGVAAEDYVQSMDEDKAEVTKALNAITKGLSEYAFESATTLPILRSLRANVSRYGKDAVEREMKDFFGTAMDKASARLFSGTSNGLKEMSGELATELTQQFSDAAAGEDVEIGKGLGDVAITSYIIGDAMTRVGGALNQRTKKEAKRYLKDLYESIPDEMSVDSKIDAMELLVKRDNLQGKKSKASEGFQKSYDQQIKNIDNELSNLYEKELAEPIDEAGVQEGVEGQQEQESPQEASQVISQVSEEGDLFYQIGEQQFENKSAFLEQIEQYKGQQNIPEITIRNDQETANQATNILREGLEQQQQQQEIEQGEEAIQAYERLNEQLDRLPEDRSPNEIGKEFAKISDQLSQDTRNTFVQKLRQKQKQFKESQAAIEADREQLIDYENQTSSEIKVDIAGTEYINPRPIIESNQKADQIENIKPVAQLQKNSFIDIDIDKNWIQDKFRKYFSARGYVPKQVFDKWVETQGKVKAEMNVVEQRRREFNKALKDAYGKTKLGTPNVSQQELEKLNEALGKLGATQELTPPEGTQIRMQFEKPPSRQEVLNDVPEKLREPLVKMRNDIDAMTKEMLDQGMIEGDLAAKFTENFGFYMTRSYKVHNDPKWTFENIPDEVKNRAINFLRKQYPNETESQITGRLENMLLKQNMPLQELRSRKLGSKDLGILKKRELNEKAIRDLLGEYKDPLYNYSASIARMADLIYREQFLRFVEQEGKDVFLYDKAEEGFNTQIAAEGSRSMAPLSGYYTTPEIAEAFETFERSEPMNAFMRWYFKVNTTVKYGKTILSPQTHVRNFTANFLFHLANGRSPIGPKGPLVTLIKDIANKNKPEWQKYWNRAVELGVVQESVWKGEIHSSIKDATKYQDDFTRQGDNLFQKISQKGRRAIEKAYQKEDDAHKLYAWEGETRRYKEVFRKKNPNKTDEQIQSMAEEQAARIVRNTMPTYSLATSKAVNFVRRFPLAGTFVSFPAEVIRNTYNTADIARIEMQDPDTRKIGIRRMAGLISALALPTAVSLLSQKLWEKDREDMDDIRKFLPPWSQNSDILYLNDKGNGVGTYIDIGYSDPYNYLKKPIIAALRGDNLEESAVEFAREFSEPFLSEELLASKLLDVQRNKQKANGEQVYNPQLPIGDRTAQIMAYLWDGVKPGAMSSLERISKSFKEYEGQYGKKYDPVNEITALMTGQRISDYNIPQSFYFKMKEFGKQYKNAIDIYREKQGRKGISETEKQQAYRQANELARKVIEKANEHYRAALRQKAPRYKIEKTVDNLYTGSFPASKEYKSMVRTGYYIPIDKY